jgi:outer membrane receptor for ferrienterochelin and colicin
MKLFFIFSIIVITQISFGQTFTIRGFVRDNQTDENLIGASISIDKNRSGTITNSFGFYSFNLKQDSVSLYVSYVGYTPVRLSFYLTRDTVIEFRLNGIKILDEIEIQASEELIQETTRMSSITLPVDQIKLTPTLMGEADPIKVIQLLPGVQGGSEGSSGLYVRGGGPDQNLILLDGVPLYNSTHLYGFFSTFNADAINHIELLKGGFPARYGGRTSSVIDISMKEGNQNQFHGNATVGVISSKILLEGPLGKDISFLVSGRRSYLNLLQSRFIKPQTEGIADDYNFYDLNAKVNYRLNDKNRIYFSAYSGRDHAGADSENRYDDTTVSFTSKTSSTINWGNAIASLRWNHIFSNRLFATFSAAYSRYKFETETEFNSTITYIQSNQSEKSYYRSLYNSGINDMSLRADFDFFANPTHYLRFGVVSIAHRFEPGVLASTTNSTLNELGSEIVNALETSVYLEDDWSISPRLKLNYGLHGAAFQVNGEAYTSLQPRINARYLTGQNLAIKLSYASMQQFVHLLTNAGIGLPTDLWVPATETVKPQQSHQVALGMAKTIFRNVDLSVESYYKVFDNVIEYKDGASFLSVSQNWEEKIEVGQGESYGLEFFLHRKTGRLNGWVGYTLSWSNRQFENLNNGEWFPYRYDRRHDIKLIMNYAITKKLATGLTWVYGTGNAVSIPEVSFASATNEGHTLDGYIGLINMPGFPVQSVLTRNGFRMRDYHRLDLNASYTLQSGKVSHMIMASIYNVYGRRNPYYLEFGFAGNQKALKQVSLFPVMPSISYTLKF